jgi:hypothetical protein
MWQRKYPPDVGKGRSNSDNQQLMLLASSSHSLLHSDMISNMILEPILKEKNLVQYLVAAQMGRRSGLPANTDMTKQQYELYDTSHDSDDRRSQHVASFRFSLYISFTISGIFFPHIVVSTVLYHMKRGILQHFFAAFFRGCIKLPCISPCFK